MAGMKDREDLLLGPAAKLRNQQIDNLEKTKTESFGSRLTSTGGIIGGLGALAALLAGEEELALGLGAGTLVGAGEGADRMNSQRQAAITTAEDGLIEQMNKDAQRTITMYNTDKAAFAESFTGSNEQASAMFGLPPIFEHASVWRDQKLRAANQMEIETLDGLLDSVRNTQDRADIMRRMYKLKGFVEPYDGYFDKIATQRQTYEDFLTLAKQTDYSFEVALDFLKGKDKNNPDVIDTAMGLLRQNKSAHVLADERAMEELQMESDLWAHIFQQQELNPGFTVDEAFQSMESGLKGDAMARDFDIEPDRFNMIKDNARLDQVAMAAGKDWVELRDEWVMLNPNSGPYPVSEDNYIAARVSSAITSTLSSMHAVNGDISQSSTQELGNVAMRANGISLDGRLALSPTEQQVVRTDTAIMYNQLADEWSDLPLEDKRMITKVNYIAARTAEISGEQQMKKLQEDAAITEEAPVTPVEEVEPVSEPVAPTMQEVLGIDVLSDDPVMREEQEEMIADAAVEAQEKAVKAEKRKVKLKAQAVKDTAKAEKQTTFKKHTAMTNDDWVGSEEFGSDGEVRSKVIERVAALKGQNPDQVGRAYDKWSRLEVRKGGQPTTKALAETMLDHLLGQSSLGRTKMNITKTKG
jgi:hypothetical protein